MKIDIVIPTFKRPEKLKRCIDSIREQSYDFWDCCVIVNGGDKETFDLLTEYERKDERIWFKSPSTRYVIDSWNYFTRNFHNTRNYDAIAWIVDDVELYEDYLERLVADMKREFPDTDGVIGATQVCPGRKDYTYKPYGQVLLGKKFIDRYKEVGYQVCCPYYSHFYQDEEMWMYANSINKFHHSQGAILKHYHPAFVKEEMDETHPLVRGEIKRKDDLIYKERRAKNLIWGREWIK